ncbi:serine/arginine repetitive matrix protein 1-like [Ptychodera flava]|uniref:serine/arginine repetitive matrix protein 1-like n=1 Tax=Ptychodera flava TaxID=63121 RepID=UPI00396A5AFB
MEHSRRHHGSETRNLSWAEVEEADQDRILLPPKRLVYGIGMANVPYHRKERMLMRQYQLAVQHNHWRWVEDTRREADVVFPEEWLYRHLLHRDPKKNRIPKRHRAHPPSSSTHESSRDVRLKTQPGLTVVKHIHRSSGEVIESSEHHGTKKDSPSRGISSTSRGVSPSRPASPQRRRRDQPPAKDGERAKPSAPLARTSEERQRHNIRPAAATASTSATRPGEKASHHGQPMKGRGKSSVMEEPSKKTKRKYEDSTLEVTIQCGGKRTRRVVNWFGQDQRGQPSTSKVSCQQPHPAKGTCACPVPGCGKESRKLKRHCLGAHIHPSLQENPRIMKAVEVTNALLKIVGWILGPEKTILDLLQHVRKHCLRKIPQTSVLSKANCLMMKKLCQANGWATPSKFQLHPPNSPAVLMHWRILVILLGRLTEEQWAEF